MAEDKLFELKILTPEEVVFGDKVISVSIPSVQGTFQVLYNHAPILAAIDKGKVKISNAKNEIIELSVEKGIAELHNNKLSICVTRAVS